MLKVWNASLVLGASTLAIVGTFLVRSGVLNSIHAFGASTLGMPFVALIAAMTVGSIYLVVSRRDVLRSEAHTRLPVFARGRVPAQQRGARWPLFRDLLGHLLPADFKGGHGNLGSGWAAVVRSLHRSARPDPRAAERRRTGDRVASGDARQRAAQLPAALGGRRCDGRRGLHRRADQLVDRRRAAVLRRGVRVRQRRPGVLARLRARDAPPPAIRRRWRSCRWCAAIADATAATSSTSASRCCSSASRPPRPSSTNRRSACRSGSQQRSAPT